MLHTKSIYISVFYNKMSCEHNSFKPACLHREFALERNFFYCIVTANLVTQIAALYIFRLCVSLITTTMRDKLMKQRLCHLYTRTYVYIIKCLSYSHAHPGTKSLFSNKF